MSHREEARDDQYIGAFKVVGKKRPGDILGLIANNQ